MKIIGKIEGNVVHPAVANTIKTMELSRPGGEVAIIQFSDKEITVMRMDFLLQVKNNKWTYENQEALEKAEMMHMIGISLMNAKKATCSWFRDNALKIYQDATEFDQNSTKSLLISRGCIFIIIVYNGKWVGGKGEVDDNLNSEEPLDPMVDLG